MFVCVYFAMRKRDVQCCLLLLLFSFQYTSSIQLIGFFLLPGYRSCIPKYNVCIWMQFSNRIRLLLKFGNQSAITTIAYFHNKMIKRSFLLFITRWIYRFRMHECASLECDSVWIFFSFSPYFCHCFVIFWHIIFWNCILQIQFWIGFSFVSHRIGIKLFDTPFNLKTRCICANRILNMQSNLSNSSNKMDPFDLICSGFCFVHRFDFFFRARLFCVCFVFFFLINFVVVVDCYVNSKSHSSSLNPFKVQRFKTRCCIYIDPYNEHLFYAFFLLMLHHLFIYLFIFYHLLCFIFNYHVNIFFIIYYLKNSMSWF